MSWTLVGQYLISGILTGGIYGLIGVAIVIIYKATKVFNFAVGTLMTLGGMICVSLITWAGLPFWAALLASLLLSSVIGYAAEKTILSPLLGQPLITMIMATLAMDSILYGSILMVWTGYAISFPEGILPGGTLFLGPFFVSRELLYSFIAGVVCFALVGILFKTTQLGLRMRATAESHEVAMAVGINITRIFSFSWMIAAMVGTMAGVLLGNRTGLQVAITSAMAFKALPAVIFGGLDSVAGAVIGGLVVGIIEKFAGGFIDPKVAEISPYIILLLVLMIRPEGLFGEKRIERL
jgi:branched-chain amino acid transport system permease protein